MDEILGKIKHVFNVLHDFDSPQTQELLELLKNAFSQIEMLETEEFRVQHFALSQLLHQQGHRCLPFLCEIFEVGLTTSMGIPVYPTEKKAETDLSWDVFAELIKRCLLAQPKEGLRLLTYKLPDLSPWSAEQVLPKVAEMLEYFALTPVEEEHLASDLANLGNSLGMYRELSRKTGVLHETYIQFEAALERLGRDGYQQLARDYAEEAIVCARADGYPEYGHYCRFSLASFQQNPIDAAIHGCLLVTSLSLRAAVPQDFQFRVLNAASVSYTHLTLPTKRIV